MFLMENVPNSKLIIIKGVPGSGKTTMANNLHYNLKNNGMYPILISFDRYEKFYFRLVIELVIRLD